MRILLADSGPTMRGGQWQTLYLARGLRDSGHSLRLMARAGSPLFSAAQAERFDCGAFGILRLRQWSQWADVIHAQDARSHTWAVLTAATPLIVSRRVAFAPKPGSFSRLKYARTTHFIAVSRYVRSVLEHSGVPRSRISVVYDGVPLPESAPPYRSRSVPLLAIQTGDAAKGDGLVAEAAALAGIRLAWAKTLPADLDAARVFAYITHSEGLGSAALLAMAHGAVVIASRCGGLEEAVEHERTGLLVENRAADIAAALIRVRDDLVLGEQLAKVAAVRVRERFSIERMIWETEAVYRSVLP